MNSTTRKLFLAALPAAMLLFVAQARAGTFAFRPLGLTSSFETPTNWSPLGGPPGFGDTALFDDITLPQYTVLFNSSPSTDRLQVTQGDVTFRPLLSSPGQDLYSVLSNGPIQPETLIDGGELTLSSNGDRRFLLDLQGRLNIAVQGSGRLTIEEGGAVQTTSAVFIGRNNGSSGAATIRGADSSWTTTANLNVGLNGFGELMIDEGARVSSTGGNIGGATGGRGNVTIQGAGSTWNAGNLFVGPGGSGQLIVSDGGNALSLDSEILRGDAFVSGVGSAWINADSLVIGHVDGSQLFVQDGGSVSTTTGTLGRSQGDVAAVLITGAGSNWSNTADLRVGDEGRTVLTISNGGSVDVSLSAVLAQDDGSLGTLIFGIGDDGTGAVASGLLNVAGELSSGAGASEFALRIDDGVALQPGDAFTLVDYGTLAAGFGFDNVNDDDVYTAGPYDFRIDFNADLDGQGDLGIVATVVPEPSAWTLAVLTLAGVFIRR